MSKIRTIKIAGIRGVREDLNLTLDKKSIPIRRRSPDLLPNVTTLAN